MPSFRATGKQPFEKIEMDMVMPYVMYIWRANLSLRHWHRLGTSSRLDSWFGARYTPSLHHLRLLKCRQDTLGT